MKIGIYSAIDVGDVKDKNIDYIAADQGLFNLTKYHIQPILAIGDFDSLESKSLLENIDCKTLPCIKDVTDTHDAIDYAIEHGYDEIDLYGVTGKRLDHFFAVMCLLYKYRNIQITIYDNYNKITLLHAGKYNILNDYKYFSLFTQNASTISITGAHYNLDNYNLKFDDPLCVSNQTDKKACITTSDDIILIQSNDKKED